MSSDEDDEEYVPEVDEHDDAHELVQEPAETSEKPTSSVVGDKRVDALWDDLNESTKVSTAATAKTRNLLSKLTKRSASQSKKSSKKQKVYDFQIPVLGLDATKKRQEIANAATNTKTINVVKFAGQEYHVSTTNKPPTKKNSSLDQVVASIESGPRKISTMEKTSMDWDQFKTEEGIEDELRSATKDGYVEKQEFLQRLDLKRFELEKAERDKQRQRAAAQQQALKAQQQQALLE